MGRNQSLSIRELSERRVCPETCTQVPPCNIDSSSFVSSMFNYRGTGKAPVVAIVVVGVRQIRRLWGAIKCGTIPDKILATWHFYACSTRELRAPRLLYLRDEEKGGRVCNTLHVDCRGVRLIFAYVKWMGNALFPFYRLRGAIIQKFLLPPPPPSYSYMRSCSSSSFDN